MKIQRRQILRLAAGAAALPAVTRIAKAQIYPTRPVRVIVPYTAGGPTDIFARLIAQKLSEHLRKQFYVENIAGATGNIGTGQAVPGDRQLHRCAVTPVRSKYPPAEPGALIDEPLEATVGSLTRPR